MNWVELRWVGKRALWFIKLFENFKSQTFILFQFFFSFVFKKINIMYDMLVLRNSVDYDYIIFLLNNLFLCWHDDSMFFSLNNSSSAACHAHFIILIKKLGEWKMNSASVRVHSRTEQFTHSIQHDKYCHHV